jgi:hypothetical protein
VNRRELLALAIGSPLLALGAGKATPKRLVIADASWRVVTSDGRPAAGVRVERTWNGSVCRSRVVNSGKQAVRLREIVLFDARHDFPPDTPL